MTTRDSRNHWLCCVSVVAALLLHPGRATSRSLLEAVISGGNLTPEQGQPLIDPAQAIIDELNA